MKAVVVAAEYTPWDPWTRISTATLNSGVLVSNAYL